MPEALLTGRVLDDSIERKVLANDDLSHVGSPWLALSATSHVDTTAPELGAGQPPISFLGRCLYKTVL